MDKKRSSSHAPSAKEEVSRFFEISKIHVNVMENGMYFIRCGLELKKVLALVLFLQYVSTILKFWAPFLYPTLGDTS
jgi:hypothetical protein